MKRLIEKIVFASFIINSLLVISTVLLPVWIIAIPDFFDKYIFFLKTSPYKHFYTFVNLAIITHWIYCLWFLFKYDKYSKSIFPLFFFNFLYAPFYYYRVKIKKRPLRNKINRPERKTVSENSLEENDFEKLTRDSIFRILELWSSKTEQLEIQNSQPDTNLTEELFLQWKELFIAGSDEIKEVFTAKEFELLTQFDKTIFKNYENLNENFVTLNEFVETLDWKELNLLATKILNELNKK